MTVSEARAVLPSLLDRVEGGEEITITRHGRPVAVLVRPDVLRRRRTVDLQQHVDRIEVLLERARQTPARAASLTAARADELVATVRGEREPR